MLITDGQWAFADSDAMDTVTRIVELHSQVVGSLPCKQPSLFLLTFPREVQADKWSAQTRGCAVSLLMGKNPSRTAALAQLGNALTHELFHLWIPNGLELTGDYDWFYEGFTLYQAARSAVRLDLVTFPEFLNANSRAYDGYLAAADRDRWSLIEASKRRWTVGASSVYSKAMVIAFLYDLNLRFQSKGKHSLDDVYRRFSRERATSAGQDGNAAAISALRPESFGAAFVQRFIVDAVAIDLPKELAQFGLGVEQVGLRTRIYARNNLTRRQRDLLRQLGYNDRSR
jgi:predicted metalloprotease with PDZ domain